MREKHWALRISLLLWASLLHTQLTWAQVAVSDSSDATSLSGQTDTLEGHWAKVGTIQRRPPFFARMGQRIPLIFEPDQLDPTTPGCLTVAVLAAPNQSFLLRFSQQSLRPARRAWPVPSASGTAEVTRCGARKPLMVDLSVSMRSQRGVFETLVLSSEHPPPPLSSLLKSRDPGPIVSAPSLSPLPHFQSTPRTLSSRRQAQAQLGTIPSAPYFLEADAQGRAQGIVQYGPGCHELFATAAEQGDKSPAWSLTRLATDEDILPETKRPHLSRYFFCTARPTRYRLEVSGAAQTGTLSIARTSYELPSGLPVEWGAHARTQLARALWSGGLPVTLTTPPVAAFLGASGATHISYSLERNACYIAAVGSLRADETRFTMSAATSSMQRSNQSLALGRGTAVSFCAGSKGELSLELQARGPAAAWMLGLWHIQGEQLP